MTFELAPGDAGYPPPLLERKRPPTLRVRGALPSVRAVAVVGKRDASIEALALTRELASALAHAGFAVWSGGAFGVDAAAHGAALDAGGPTVVVLGGGLDRPSPAEHAPLFARVLEAGGAHVAIMEDGAPASTAGFIARNAVLAACTEATLVVEAGKPSGALSTARAARRFGRPVLVVPHAPWDARGLGCIELLREGARVVASPAHLLDALGVAAPEPPQLSLALATAPSTSRPRAASPLPLRALEPDELAVVSALSAEPVHFDVICERAHLAPSRAAAALLTLALDAVVVEEPAGSFRRASSFL